MYKPNLVCPACGQRSGYYTLFEKYVCKCGWDSTVNTVDISFDEPNGSAISNVFPHNFVFYSNFPSHVEINCSSMESFIQSLRVKDPELQKYICEHYSGTMSQKLKACLRDWRQDGLVYWQGVPIKRDSATYTELITTAYDCLFESNPVFRQLVLPSFKGKYLIHTIGKDSEAETLLTEQEFRFQLNRLIQRLDFPGET